MKMASGFGRGSPGIVPVLFLALVLVSGPLTGQGVDAPPGTNSAPASTIELKNRAPVSDDVLDVSLPVPVETTLEGGLHVLILEDHRLPLVDVELRIDGAGPIFEPVDLAGLASVTAQMLRRGTETRSSEQISEEVDRLGATLDASAAFGSTAATVSASGLAANFDDWFALLADIVLHPAFPPDELGRLRQRLKIQLREQRSSPQFLAGRAIQQGGLRRPPSIRRVRITAVTGQDHRRDPFRLASQAVRASGCDPWHCRRCRCLQANSKAEGLVRRLEDGRPGAGNAGGSRPETHKNGVPDRPSGLRPGHRRDGQHRSRPAGLRLYSNGRDEPDSRWRGGFPPVRQSPGRRKDIPTERTAR